MRKLLSTLAALAVLATCNVQLAVAQSTVPMVMTLHGDGTITGDLTGHLYGDGELDLTAPALTGAAVASSFTGTCDAAHILFGDGSCKALNSSLILGTFTGTCNSTTFLAGNGACSAPTSTQTIAGFSGTCSASTYLRADGTCQPVLTAAFQASAVTRSSNSPSLDSTLQFAVSTVGTYEVDCYVTVNASNGTGVQLEISYSGTKGGNDDWSGIEIPAASSVVATTGGTSPINDAISFTTSGSNNGYRLSSLINASTTGTAGLSWASGTSSVGVTMEPGSWCQIVKL